MAHHLQRSGEDDGERMAVRQSRQCGHLVTYVVRAPVLVYAPREVAVEPDGSAEHELAHQVDILMIVRQPWGYLNERL